MTCNDALRALLDADLEVVAAGDASPLGLHVAGCARCQAVLAGLRADTSRLAAVTARHPVLRRATAPRTGRAARWLLRPIPLAATALLAFVVLTQTVRTRTMASTSTVPASHPDSATGVAPSAADTMGAPAANTRALAREAIAQTGHRAERIAATPFPPPTRLETGGPLLAQSSPPVPVLVDPVALIDVPATVAVATAGGRAVVLRPSNENITVVWFY
ncbi:MAG: hypothetical protein ACYC7F_10890 [Gemmatimonadaceae bacterium]